MSEFNAKKFDRKLIRKILIPTIIKLYIWFMFLNYMKSIEILKASTVLDIKTSTIGLVGVYIGVTVYRSYLEHVLPQLGVSLDEVDELTADMFPKKQSLWNKYIDRHKE